MFALFKNSSATFSRYLGLLLVVFILYGTTVEAAHKHGRILSPASNAASLVGPGSSSTTLNTTSGCSDCLICQLHQNFSATLISITPNAETVKRQAHLRRADPVLIRSIDSSPQSGRAPPQAN
ncbi:MAG TPA: hypothetical protein VI031_00295 [Pyrinomonadaceae bacterium]